MHSRIIQQTFMVATPLLLSGCMMLGSGGGAHGSQGGEHARAPSMMAQTVIKETVAEGLRITAEFPPYAIGDDLAYKLRMC